MLFESIYGKDDYMIICKYCLYSLILVCLIMVVGRLLLHDYEYVV